MNPPKKFSRSRLSAGIALAMANVVAVPAVQAGYQSGDFHNHTTCSDGSTSVKRLTDVSLTYLDWFIQTGHSGASSTDCRLDDLAYDGRDPDIDCFRDGYCTPGPEGEDEGDNFFYTVGPRPGGIKGDQVTSSYRTGATPSVEVMWRWQSLQEFEMGQIRQAEVDAGGKPAFLAEEWVLPGHEHGDVTVIRGQYDPVEDFNDLNPEGLAQFEYCFARPSNDTSQGGGQGWTCEISEENNQKLIDRFAQDPDDGLTNYDGVTTGDYNGTLLPEGVKTSDTGDHIKSVAAGYWLEENYPTESFLVPAHIARQGAFVPDDNEGYNVEHFRDYHNAAPEVAFGFEGEPGHQAQHHRGSYNAGRPTSGGFTYGGGDCYANAEASRPGVDFDGVPLTADRLENEFDGVYAGENPEKVTLCRPGVRTMWDALLSEGRRYWYFGSSDWHNRGNFSPFTFESTNDFWPGEFQKNYAFVRDNNPDNPAQDIVDGLRSGDGWVVMGDLITDIRFEACVGNTCAGMGETLVVNPGDDVRVSVAVKDPEGKNHSPYSFDNPSLLQIGMEVPLDEPELVRVDMIKGEVHGLIPATLDDGSVNPDYEDPLAPETTVIEASWSAENRGLRGRGEWKRARYTLRDVTADSYIRLRGTNIPAGTPNEQDEDGNPLPDNLSDNILCTDPACPEHLRDFGPIDPDTGEQLKILDYDVEAWADLWFHSNPIFIEVRDTTVASADD